MKMTKETEFSFAPIHPGELLRDDTMSGHGWDVKTLAEKMGVAESKVNDLINERIPIDQDLSERLGKALDIHKDCWLRAQQNYEMKLIEAELKDKMEAAGTPVKFNELNKQKTVLAVLSTTRPNTRVGSVHAQKIMFKIDKEINKSDVWFPEFNFVPYKHGPFDHELTAVFNNLSDEGLVDIAFPPNSQEWKKRKYVLNAKGREIGMKFFDKIQDDIKTQVVQIVEWAMNLSMDRLKSEIYSQYPEYEPENS